MDKIKKTYFIFVEIIYACFNALFSAFVVVWLLLLYNLRL